MGPRDGGGGFAIFRLTRVFFPGACTAKARGGKGGTGGDCLREAPVCIGTITWLPFVRLLSAVVWAQESRQADKHTGTQMLGGSKERRPRRIIATLTRGILCIPILSSISSLALSKMNAEDALKVRVLSRHPSDMGTATALGMPALKYVSRMRIVDA